MDIMKKEVLVLIVFVFFISGCGVENSSVLEGDFESMKYFVVNSSGVLEEFVNITFSGNKIFLEHGINYDCCGELSLNYRISRDVLRIYEDNNNLKQCEEICFFEISAEVKENGINEVELYGVRYSDWPYEFIAEEKR